MTAVGLNYYYLDCFLSLQLYLMTDFYLKKNLRLVIAVKSPPHPTPPPVHNRCCPCPPLSHHLLIPGHLRLPAATVSTGSGILFTLIYVVVCAGQSGFSRRQFLNEATLLKNTQTNKQKIELSFLSPLLS